MQCMCIAERCQHESMLSYSRPIEQYATEKEMAVNIHNWYQTYIAQMNF